MAADCSQKFELRVLSPIFPDFPSPVFVPGFPSRFSLLQTRSKVLNDELEDVFRRWYPQFRTEEKAAACPPALRRTRARPLYLRILETGHDGAMAMFSIATFSPPHLQAISFLIAARVG